MDTIWNNLGGILTGGALFVTAIGTVMNIWFTQRNKWKIDAVEKKVDGGVSELQRALADIAKTASAAAATGAPRAVRASDLKVDS